MRGVKADLGLNVALMFPHYFQYNQHPEPLLPSIALYCTRSGATARPGVGRNRRQIWAWPGPGGLLSTACAIYYQLYRLKKSPPAARVA